MEEDRKNDDGGDDAALNNQKVPTNIASRGAERARYLADTEFRTSPDREH